MIARFLLCFVCLFASAYADEPVSYDDHMAAARAAFVAEDWPALATALDAAQGYRPYSLYLTKNRVLAYEMNGERAKALATVRKVAKRGLAMDLSGHKAFDTLKNDAAYQVIGARMESNMAPIGASWLVMSSEHYIAINEALAVDLDGKFITGSVLHGDIIQSNVGRDTEYPSISVRGGVFDIELSNETLLAAVNSHFGYVDFAIDRPAPLAAVIGFDRTTGDELFRHQLGGEDALIGDIEIASDGVIYASDSVTARIFGVDPGDGNKITEFTDPRFVNLQGIALDEENGRLFIADYLTGLWVMDLESGDVKLIRNGADAHLGGIDGLYLYKGDLIGVQNGTTPQRIVRVSLSEDGAAATALDVLAQNLPEWNEPTHGVVVGKMFYYIATSNWPSYDAENGWAEREDNPPQPLRVMSVDLD